MKVCFERGIAHDHINGWGHCHLSAAALGNAPVEITELLLQHSAELRVAKDLQPSQRASGVSWVILSGCAAANWMSGDNFYAFMSEWSGSGPLHYAAMRGDVNLVRVLTGHGFSMAAPNSRGRTPIHVACLFGHVHVVRHFGRLNGFADAAQLKDTHTGKTARQLVEAGGRDADLELLALLPHEKLARPWVLCCPCTESSPQENIDCEEVGHESDRKDHSSDEMTASVLRGRTHPAELRKCQEGDISKDGAATELSPHARRA